MQETHMKVAVAVGLATLASMFAVDLLAPQVALFYDSIFEADEMPIVEAVHAYEPVWVLQEQLSSYKYKDPNQRFSLYISVGNLYRDRGHYTRAFMQYDEAHRLAMKLDSDACRFSALHMLGLTRYLQGKLQAAKQFLEQATHLKGADIPHIKVLHTLANVQRDMGHLDVSLEVYWQAWESGTSRGRLDAEHLPLLVADMAEAYIRLGELETARGYLQQALDQHLENIEFFNERGLAPTGTEAIDLAMIRSLFGGMHHARGDVVRAMEFYRSARRGQAQLLSQGHPDLVSTDIGIARAQRDVGNWEAALKTIQLSEMVIRQGPQEGPDLSRVLILKADMLREAQRFAEAQQAIKEALKLQAIWYADGDHPEEAVASSMYGSLLHDQGDFEAALHYYTLALDVSMKTVGQRHPETAAIHNSLGTLYEDVGDSKTASEHFTTCLTIQLNTVGERSLDVGTTYNNLATLMFRQGMAEDAAWYLRKALHALDLAGVPKTSPERAIYSENLAEVLSFCKSKGLEEVACQGADDHREASIYR